MAKKTVKKIKSKKSLDKAASKKRAKGVVKLKLPKIIIKKTKFFALIIGLFFVLFADYYLFVNPVNLKMQSYTIQSGASISSVSKDLNLGFSFKILVMFQGNEVQAGTYDIKEDITIYGLSNMMAHGRVASTTITVPEGLTIKQIENILKADQFLTGDVKNNYKDGELFPDTYIVAKGMTRLTVLDLMAKKMETIQNGCMQAVPIFPNPLKDWNEVMTLASIVQKETARVDEMPIVASVYLNRLRKRMRLQADPTVVYAITKGLGDMRQKKLYTKYLMVKNPYNTYKNYGLPPAPIANVGMDAIKAVLNPADTSYYYFVADGTGGHIFSTTLEEHNRHRIIWQAIKNGKK